MKKRILFVDDEPAALEGLRRMLRAQTSQWDMQFASGVDAALEQVRRNDIDAVVSDVMMPGKDGFELLQALRSSPDTQDIPVIILTGAGQTDLKRRALDLGATDLLTKPAQPEDLVARIRSVLRLKSYQDQLKAQNEILERKVQERTAELQDSRLDIIWCLAKAAEYRDERTGNHVVRVGCCCRLIGEALGLPRDFVEALFLTSPLHDIGKIGIPDRVLLKPGPLSPAEWELMKQHCAIGAEILRHDAKIRQAFRAWGGRCGRPEAATGNPILEMASSIALTHHERWDGSGYPEGLAGEAIPLESRITALVDMYDALRSPRPYKPAFTEAEALRVMREQVGLHLDPRVYEVFQASLDEFRRVRAELPDEEYFLAEESISR